MEDRLTRFKAQMLAQKQNRKWTNASKDGGIAKFAAKVQPKLYSKLPAPYLLPVNDSSTPPVAHWKVNNVASITTLSQIQAANPSIALNSRRNRLLRNSGYKLPTNQDSIDVKFNNSSLLDGKFDEEESSASFKCALSSWRKCSVDQANTCSNMVVQKPPSNVPIVFSPIPKMKLDTAVVNFNEVESHESFLEALHEWRGVIKNETKVATMPSEVVVSSQTANTEIEQTPLKIIYPENMTYLDRMILNNLRNPTVIQNEGCDREYGNGKVFKPELVVPAVETLALHNPTFAESITQKQNSIEDINNDQDLLHVFGTGARLSSLELVTVKTVPNIEVTIEDVTDCEEDCILESLEKGIMVECVPPSELHFVYE